MAAYCKLCGYRDPSTGGMLCRRCDHAFSTDTDKYGITVGDVTSDEWVAIQKIRFTMEREGKSQSDIDAAVAEYAESINAERRKKLAKSKSAQKQPITINEWMRIKFPKA